MGERDFGQGLSVLNDASAEDVTPLTFWEGGPSFFHIPTILFHPMVVGVLCSNLTSVLIPDDELPAVAIRVETGHAIANYPLTRRDEYSSGLAFPRARLRE